MATEDRIIPINIEEEMKSAYIDYSMSVIVSRALPDVRDGLKPVHRRILYGMEDLGLRYNKSHKKSARVVGEVLGKYHPHGDSSVYDAMVRMAQDWSLRYPLVDGQGNFGSVDGDSPAAMRYTEARLQRISDELLEDIKKDTVDFQLNFDDSLKEPTVLPSRIPNLLINGASGIAVGMATNMLPHNLSEVIDGTIATIDNPEITIDELTQHIKAPDFPTGGIIYGVSGVKEGFETGRGKVIVRRTKYDLKKAEERAHILEGLLIALDHLDEVIKLIRNSKTVVEAKQGLMSTFKLSEIQAKAILEMRLQKLTGLERDKVREEYDELQKKIAHYQAILGSEEMQQDIIKGELSEIKERFGDERRTEINYAAGDISIEDMIPDEEVVITISHLGYIKRTKSTEYRAQGRGGRGSKGSKTRNEDFIEHMFLATTHNYLLLFTEQGRCFWLRAQMVSMPFQSTKAICYSKQN